jgi:hypothetical protein
MNQPSNVIDGQPPAVVHNWVLFHKDLSNTDKVIYAVLSASPYNYSITNKDLQAATNTSESTSASFYQGVGEGRCFANYSRVW